MKLLHIDSSVLGPHSVSRQVSAAIVDRLRKATPGLEIVYRDLSSSPPAHLSGSHLAAASAAAPYAAGTPAAVGEHLETYLRWVFGFIGVKDLEFISADGVQVGPEHREKALAGALQAATNLHAA